MSPADESNPRRVRSRELSAVDLKLFAQPLKLMPLYDPPQIDDTRRPEELSIRNRSPDRLGVLLRVGKNDLTYVCNVVGHVINPAGVVVGLSDDPRAVAAAGRAARRVEVPLLTDSVFFRCAMPRARISQSLAKLAYAPPAEHGPWTPADLGRSALPGLVRAVFQEQDGRQHGAWMAPTVVLDADPRTLEIADRLLATSIDTRPAFGCEPLVAPLVIDLPAYSKLTDQVHLVDTLGRHRPDAYLVSLAGVDTSGARLASAIRLLLLLNSLGVPVLLAKAGGLRVFAIAFDLAGFETGLGRLGRFDLNDFRGHGGAGRWPAYFEIRDLLSALHPEIAARVRRSSALPGEPCDCPACRAGWSPGDAEGTVVHDASVISADVDGAQTGPVDARVASLQRSISEARHSVDELFEAGVDVRQPTRHLARWAEAIEVLRRWGLDEPDAAGRLRDAA
ncbi:MAG: hypothetical protein WD844_14730 [Thermoleophilaceae bacterium]